MSIGAGHLFIRYGHTVTLHDLYIPKTFKEIWFDTLGLVVHLKGGRCAVKSKKGRRCSEMCARVAPKRIEQCLQDGIDDIYILLHVFTTYFQVSHFSIYSWG